MNKLLRQSSSCVCVVSFFGKCGVVQLAPLNIDARWECNDRATSRGRLQNKRDQQMMEHNGTAGAFWTVVLAGRALS